MLTQKLEEQLKLLRNAVELFDAGNVEEALNIAIRIRVLFYDTNSSKSVLMQLGQKKTIKLLSTIDNSFFDELNLKNVTAIPVMHTGNGQKAFLNDTKKQILLTVKDWFEEQILIINDKPYSRIDLVLLTSNKDGSAHVDIKDENLQQLVKSIGTYTIQENNKKVTREICNHHHIILRQMAHEVLNSMDLYKFNDIKFVEIKEYKKYNDYLIEGDYLSNNKEYYKSIKSYEKAIYVNPDNCSFAYNNMGISLLRMNEESEAIICFKKAVEQDKTFIDPLCHLSDIYYRRKRYDLSIDLYQKVLDIDKEHKYANNNFRVLLDILKYSENEIINQYNMYEENRPNNETYINLLGCSLLKFNYYSEAEKLYKYALEGLENNLDFINNLLYSLTKQKKYEEANILLEKVKNVNLSRVDILSNILEFKLFYNYPDYKFFLFQLKDKEDVLYKIFDFLFKIREKEINEKEIIEYTSNSMNETIQYNYKDIEEWLVFNKINKNVLTYLKKHLIIK